MGSTESSQEISGLEQGASVGSSVIALRPAEQGQDAYVASANPQQNYGGRPQISAGAWTISGSPYAVRSLVRFDLAEVPAGAELLSARLDLYAETDNPMYGQGVYNGELPGHSTLSGSNASFLKRVTSPWNEDSVTFASYPTTSSVGAILLSSSTSPSQDYLAIDVTEMVRGMLQEPANNHGFSLELETESPYRELTFASSEHPNVAKRPRLLLEISGGQNGQKKGKPCHANFWMADETGTTATFEALNIGQGPLATSALNWTFNGPNGPFFDMAGQSVTVDFSNPGEYDVCLELYASSGCTDIECKKVTVGTTCSVPECKTDCRVEKGECTRSCRTIKKSCKDQCSGLSGKAKRSCKKECRQEHRVCKDYCKEDRRICKISCEQFCSQ